MGRTKTGDIWERLKREARQTRARGDHVPTALVAIMELNDRIKTIWTTILYLQKRVNNLEQYYAVSPTDLDERLKRIEKMLAVSPPRSDPEPPEPSPTGP